MKPTQLPAGYFHKTPVLIGKCCMWCKVEISEGKLCEKCIKRFDELSNLF